jgi:translation initiation factor IF-1
MCERKEIIVLDARVVDVIGVPAFRAELANGHRFTAFLRKADRAYFDQLKPGDTVKVEMSPFDMSTGRIRLERAES